MKKLMFTLCLFSLSMLGLLPFIQAQAPATQEVELLARYAKPATQAVQIQGQYAYVGLGFQPSDPKELHILDLSRPKSPTLVGQLELVTADPISDIQVVGNIAYVTVGWQGLQLIDISQPNNPRKLGNIDTPGRVYRIVISGTRVYVANGTSGLRIIDVSNPELPLEIGKYDTSGEATDLRLIGSQIYLADGSRGVQVIDISNPSQPVIKQNYKSLFVQQLFSSQTTLYMANQLQNGLYIAPLNNPTQTTFYPLTGQVHAMSLAKNLLYVAADSGGLHVLDLTTPLSPTKVGYYDTDGTALNLAVTRSDVYVADGANGLLALRYIGPTSHAVLQIAPSSLTFTARQGGSSPPSQSLTLNNGSHGNALDWTVQENIPWLSVDNTTGTNNGEVNVTVDNTGLVTGTYTGQLTFSGNDAADSPQAVTVSLRVDPPPSGVGDAYEVDNSCDQAMPIATDGTIQEHTFHIAGDEDWVKFAGIAGKVYQIEVRVPDGSPTDVVMKTFKQGCNSDPQLDDSFNPNINIQLKAPRTGDYVLQLMNTSPDVFGTKVAYQISVRVLSPQNGALVLVAGSLYRTDHRQDNIHQASNAAYNLFLRQGYDANHIYYLATDLNLDADKNPDTQDVDALASTEELKYAITQWAIQPALGLKANSSFTVYLFDHGDEDKFFIDGHQQIVTSQELDNWLSTLESALPGVRVNIIIDACLSGSFIRLPNSLSRPNRVIIASTTNANNAYTSQEGGMNFSDLFIQALGSQQSLYHSFMEAKEGANAWKSDQVAWIDDNGDGQFDSRDGLVAQRRGFASEEPFPPDKIPPYIVKVVEPPNITNRRGVVTVDARDYTSQSKLKVWGVVYKPSYIAPPASTELADEPNLPIFGLTKNGSGLYEGVYEGFDEPGTYRVVIYATNEGNLQSKPKVMTYTIPPTPNHTIYLPLIRK